MAMILHYLKSRVRATNRCHRRHGHSEIGEIALHSAHGKAQAEVKADRLAG